jgi:hypothetical protein
MSALVLAVKITWDLVSWVFFFPLPPQGTSLKFIYGEKKKKTHTTQGHKSAF